MKLATIPFTSGLSVEGKVGTGIPFEQVSWKTVQLCGVLGSKGLQLGGPTYVNYSLSQLIDCVCFRPVGTQPSCGASAPFKAFVLTSCHLSPWGQHLEGVQDLNFPENMCKEGMSSTEARPSGKFSPDPLSPLFLHFLLHTLL